MSWLGMADFILRSAQRLTKVPAAAAGRSFSSLPSPGTSHGPIGPAGHAVGNLEGHLSGLVLLRSVAVIRDWLPN